MYAFSMLRAYTQGVKSHFTKLKMTDGMSASDHLGDVISICVAMARETLQSF